MDAETWARWCGSVTGTEQGQLQTPSVWSSQHVFHVNWHVGSLSLRDGLGKSTPEHCLSKNCSKDSKEKTKGRLDPQERRVCSPHKHYSLFRNQGHAINPFIEGSKLWGHTRHRQAAPKLTGIWIEGKIKTCPKGLECKSRKSRNTWSNGQIWPWNMEWSRAKTNSFAKKMTGHNKHPLPTTQEKTTHGHNQRVNTEIRLIIFFGCKAYNQSDFGVDHLVMSIYRVFSYVLEDGVCYDQCIFLAKLC